MRIRNVGTQPPKKGAKKRRFRAVFHHFRDDFDRFCSPSARRFQLFCPPATRQSLNMECGSVVCSSVGLQIQQLCRPEGLQI